MHSYEAVHIELCSTYVDAQSPIHTLRVMTVSRKVRANEYTTGRNMAMPKRNQNHLTVVTTETAPM
jgi:hypothetical protein